jgi:hypothetical protein
VCVFATSELPETPRRTHVGLNRLLGLFAFQFFAAAAIKNECINSCRQCEWHDLHCRGNVRERDIFRRLPYTGLTNRVVRPR